jgi:hypothetical protein
LASRRISGTGTTSFIGGNNPTQVKGAVE